MFFNTPVKNVLIALSTCSNAQVLSETFPCNETVPQSIFFFESGVLLTTSPPYTNDDKHAINTTSKAKTFGFLIFQKIPEKE